MNKRTLAVSLAALIPLAAPGQDRLREGFLNPPEETKPWCYWYWISDNISREGITRDLEAMRRVGIGEALIGNIFLSRESGAEVPVGDVKVCSPEWWGMIEHAIREGGRLGVNIGLFNCPGWSQSGGPWISSTQTMRYLTWSETRVTGPRRFEQKLAAPHSLFQDVAVLAVPAPQQDDDNLAARRPKVTCEPANPDAAKLVDGDLATALVFAPAAPFTVEIELADPITVRSAQVFPADVPFAADVELQAADPAGAFQTLRRFKCDWSNLSPAVGFIPQAPAVVSFAPATAKRFRLVFTNVTPGHRNFVHSQGAALAEINLTGAARLERFVEKQLGKMHPTPLPMWDAYLWPAPVEPDAAGLAVPLGQVRDLNKQLSADGTLRWAVPPGDWIIQRIGMTPTGMSNAPAAPEGCGYEVDKMNRQLAQYHFDAFVGEVLRRMPAAERKAFKHVVADSYEMGAQNWTEGFDEAFQRRYGYDPKPWLPVLSGRLVGSADQSERFLWDLRRLVADRVATEYVGGLRAACRAHGLELWLENYGHWGFPGEFLKYGGESDRVAGEYWVTGDLGSIECRAASSCANIYGKKFVSAESWTGGPPFQNAPAHLKARGDWSFCEGVNHVVLHVYIHQPWEDKRPGINAPWGTEFNRHNTWFDASRTWVDYLRRACWLLQQGYRVADVAYFIGDDAPKMTGVRNPELPPGRDFDYINSEVIEQSLTVRDGMLALPHGTTYRVLVLPDLPTMRPEVLRKIRDLVRAGATVLGPPPSRSPSLQNYPRCDVEVQRLARELWGDADVSRPGERSFGKGRVVWGKSLAELFAAGNVPPDFESATELRFTHRCSGNTDIYFVANPHAQPLTTSVAFRVSDRAPELWWPDSGRIELPAVFDVADGRVQMPLNLGPHGSVFVVFREKLGAFTPRIVAATRDDKPILSAKFTASPQPATATGATNSFTLAFWVKPEAETDLPAESHKGTAGVNARRNEIILPTHGSEFGDGRRHAGVGVAVGRNGVAVFEHAANHFPAVLVHPANISDWTHVAVVYREGQPSLYLNGRLVRQSRPSGLTVHPGRLPQSGATSFVGHWRGASVIPRALSESELAELVQKTPRPHGELAGPELELHRTADGKISGRAWAAGNYRVQTAAGRSFSFNVSPVPESLELGGPWEVQFTPGWEAPEKVTFDRLTDWTQRPEEGIRHYSGRAVYRKTFTVPAAALADATARWVLDLGRVHDLAVVRLNGKEVGTLWLAPWQVDVTGTLRAGANDLEVEVINAWNNRLVRDAGLPPEQRRTFLAVPTVTTQTALRPAGLLGPVTLRSAVRVSVKLQDAK